MPKKNNKVLLEMSGGLDSSCAAILLQKKGYDVIGVMMHLHDSETFSNDLQVAKDVAKKLNIDFQVADYRKKFKEEVIDYFINTYKEAKTPNPCIVCNQKMKFGAIFDFSQKLDCDHIATGHYANIIQNKNAYELHKAKDLSKDQSYVLHFLNQDQLLKILFPLGEYTKEEVRALAQKENLPCVDKPESQDICFVEDKTYSDFIQNNSDYVPTPGNVIDTKGNVLGQHEGLINYTIGQRKGLGIAGGDPLYVLSLNKDSNDVVLGSKNETFANEVRVSNFS